MKWSWRILNSLCIVQDRCCWHSCLVLCDFHLRVISRVSNHLVIQFFSFRVFEFNLRPKKKKLCILSSFNFFSILFCLYFDFLAFVRYTNRVSCTLLSTIIFTQQPTNIFCEEGVKEATGSKVSSQSRKKRKKENGKSWQTDRERGKARESHRARDAEFDIPSREKKNISVQGLLLLLTSSFHTSHAAAKVVPFYLYTRWWAPAAQEKKKLLL